MSFYFAKASAPAGAGAAQATVPVVAAAAGVKSNPAAELLRQENARLEEQLAALRDRALSAGKPKEMTAEEELAALRDQQIEAEAYQAALQAALQGQSGEEGSKLPLYIGLGLGGLVLVVAVTMLAKPKSVGGYRRRRRSRRRR